VPNAPSNLTGTAVSTTQINVSWTDNSSNETGFSIERCTGNSCTNSAEVGTVGANVTTFPSTGLTKNTWYRFRVRAFNASGNSAFSNVISVKTPQK
jgi:predicted phage tail protein